MRSVSIVGIGRAGGALAIALDRGGVPIEQLIYRYKPPMIDGLDPRKLVPMDSLRAVSADVLIIATADQDIRSTTASIADSTRLPAVALHLSGSLDSSELSRLKSAGVNVGSMHPLVSISDAELGSRRFSGAYFCVEGDTPAVEAALSLIESLGGLNFCIEKESKPLYHASAVMASGNVTALFDAAIEMLSKCGLTKEDAQRILYPLLKSTVANLSTHPTERALTGPFVRGDEAALERHLESFKGKITDDIRTIYLDLAERSVRLAGGDSSTDLLTAINMAKRKTGC